jgi:prephenate dehydrogenase
MNVGIIGVGLIGGSLAMDLRRRGFASWVTGVESDAGHAATALENGIVDEMGTLENMVEKSDLIILACPIDSIKRLLPVLLDMVGGTKKTVTDTGSTKAGMCKLVADHPNRSHYVAAHPMAGTEHSGPLAALQNLFDNKCTIICESEKSGREALSIVLRMFRVLNMKPVYMDAEEHDVSAAYVSHISHISSFALSLCVLNKEKNHKRILSLAGGGFESTVRLAKSEASTWVPVFEQNAAYVLEVLNTYIDTLQTFKEHIENKNNTGIRDMILEANAIKKILKEKPLSENGNNPSGGSH